MGKLKIAIDYRVDDPRQGVGTALLALAHGLSHLPKGDQEYVFIVYDHSTSWLEPHIGGSCSIASVRSPGSRTSGWIKSKLRGWSWLRRLWTPFRPTNRLPTSDGAIERLGCDVVHFPSQIAYMTEVPSIYQPWDLQHCHYPEFFTAEQLHVRNVRYPTFCRQAHFVCVQTEWGKQDLIDQYGIETEKIVVIRWGTAFEAYQPPLSTESAKVREQLGLPEEFFLFPAITWPHKNHELILRTLGEMKRSNRFPHVVFTGSTTPYRETLDRLAADLGVQDQVDFLGFVSSDQVQSLFQLAVAMIFPSRFEGLGLPVLEAFRVGLPVLCSTASVLPEVAGDAALFFDPDSPTELMSAMERIRSTPDLRADLVEKGRRILDRYSADQAARGFAALYRATAQKGSNR